MLTSRRFYKKSQKLYLDGRHLNDIRILNKFTNLRNLSISYVSGSITDIPIWKKALEKVGILKIEKLNTIDLNPIKKLDTLNSLDLAGIYVKNITSLSELKYLTHLNLSQTNMVIFKNSQILQILGILI